MGSSRANCGSADAASRMFKVVEGAFSAMWVAGERLRSCTAGSLTLVGCSTFGLPPYSYLRGLFRLLQPLHLCLELTLTERLTKRSHILVRTAYN